MTGQPPVYPPPPPPPPPPETIEAFMARMDNTDVPTGWTNQDWDNLVTLAHYGAVTIIAAERNPDAPVPIPPSVNG